MPRVKRGTMHTKRRKNILADAKGYMWGRKSKLKLAKTAVLKAGRHAYRDRHNKKRVMRNLWTIRLNAAARENGTTYSKLIDALKKKNIVIDRKVLSEIARQFPAVFTEICKATK